MKGMKKLFALLAVLTMALTLTPMVAPVAAADDYIVTITPEEATVYEGQTVEFKVKVTSSSGFTVDPGLISYSWLSTATDVATVPDVHTSTALVSAVGAGTAQIKAFVKVGSTFEKIVAATINVVEKPTTPEPGMAEIEAEQAATGSNVVTATVSFEEYLDKVDADYLVGARITIPKSANLGGATLTLTATIGSTLYSAASATIPADGSPIIILLSSASLAAATGTEGIWTIAITDGVSPVNPTKIPNDFTMTFEVVSGKAADFTTTTANLVVLASKEVEMEAHTFTVEPVQQILPLTANGVPGTATIELKFDGEDVLTASAKILSASLSNSVVIASATVSGNPVPISTATSLTATPIVVEVTPAGVAGSSRMTIVVQYTDAYSHSYTATAYIDVIVSQPSVPVTLYNAQGSWVRTNVLSYKVTYDVVGGFDTQNQVVQLIAGNKVVGYAQLGQPVYATFADLYNEMGGKDGYLTLKHVGGTSSVTVPITFLSLDDSTFKSSYVSGEPVGEVTGTINNVAGTDLSGNINLALVAVWTGPDGSTKSATVHTFTATRTSDDKTTATFSIASGAFRFDVPAGSVYLVSENIAANTKAGKVYGVSVAKYAYKTITITQGTLVANPSTVNAPVNQKEIYLYDQFGYPLKDTPVKVQYGYKDANGDPVPATTVTTDGEGKVKLNFPQPYAFGTYTATISTVKSDRYVDGVVALTVTYAGGFVLADNIQYSDPIGPVTVNLSSTGAKIKRLWVTVEDPDGVLYPNGDFADNDEFLEFPLAPASGFDLAVEYANANACGVKVSDYYWKTATPVNAVSLTGWTVQGGSFKVTAKAELTDGTFVTDTKTYVVKNFRVESITPASTTYGTATTVKIVVKDWYGSYADKLEVKLVGPDSTTYTFIGGDFGTYTYNIPASAKPGIYKVLIGGKDYTGDDLDGVYFVVAPVADLKVTAPATVNAMSKFDVVVTDKDGNAVNGTWRIPNPLAPTLYTTATGLVVNGRFTVDTAQFSKGSPLGAYDLIVTTNDGAHRGKVTFNVIAPATITPTVVTNGLKSTFVVNMTATGMSASLVAIRETSRAVLQVVNDKFNPDKVTTVSVTYSNIDVSGQTASITVVAHKQRECSNAVVRLLYGNFVLGSVAVEHPQLSFVNTGTLYAGDVVPVQVKLVDALGNPVKGAVIKLSQLGYFEYTATTNAEGIADFGNITLSVAGNMVAELVFGPDQQRVIDYRLIGQTDNTNYKIVAQILPARPAQDLKVTVTPTIVDAGKDALLTLTLVGADDKPVETGKSVVVTIGPSTYNGLVGANGVVTLTVKAESLTGTVVTGVVKVEGYNAATFTLAVTEKPVSKTVIELAPGMDIYTVNGETKFWDATPYIKNGRTLVPIRHLAEAIGFKADWDFSDPANKMVFIYTAEQDPEKDKEHPFILLIIGQPTAMVNGNLVALDVAPEILNGRTMVPLRFVVETLGYQVEWLGNTIRLMK